MGATALADFALVEQRLTQTADAIEPATPWTTPKAAAWDGTTFGQWHDANSIDAEST